MKRLLIAILLVIGIGFYDYPVDGFSPYGGTSRNPNFESVAIGTTVRFRGAVTVATIPVDPVANDVILVTDGTSACDQTTGEGAYVSYFRYSGAAWVCVGDGGSTTLSSLDIYLSPNYVLVGTVNSIGAADTQFDITNPAGTTFRYTWDGTGTDPGISATEIPIGAVMYLNAQNFAAGNKGTFTVTGSGTNYFEVTNAGGAAETNKTIGTGSMGPSRASASAMDQDLASVSSTHNTVPTAKAVKEKIQYKSWSFDPKAVCDGAVDRLFLMSAHGGQGVIVTAWKISFEADPTTEVDLDLKRADAWIGVANAAVMDVLDTTTGASSEATTANINGGAAVAEGKVIYLEFGTAYTEANHQVIFEMWFYEVGS